MMNEDACAPLVVLTSIARQEGRAAEAHELVKPDTVPTNAQQGDWNSIEPAR